MTFRQLLAGCGLSGPIRAPTIWRRPRLADFLRETADRLCLGDVEPSLGEKILDVSVAEREPQVDPDRMLDDKRRKPVTSG
jgi:hypothetical protein